MSMCARRRGGTALAERARVATRALCLCAALPDQHRNLFHAPPTRKRPRRPAARSRRARRPAARRRPVLVIVAAVIVVVVAVVIVVALVVLRLSGRGFRRALPLLEAARL